MTKLLFWIALVVLVVMAIRAKLRAEIRRSAAARREDQPQAPSAAIAEAMARCAVDNLLAALAGERPANLVNPGAWRG